MRQISKRTDAGGVTTPADKGFTLMEILIVIVILGVLVSLSVSIGSYLIDESGRKKTQAIQLCVLEAIDAFRDDTGEYPDGIDPNDDPNSYDYLDTIAFIQELKLNPMAREKLKSLPEDAFPYDDPSDPNHRDLLADGFKCPQQMYDKWFMVYNKSAGLGGRPVLISVCRLAGRE